MKKNQSKRLTDQHKLSQGVVGIFGNQAKWHDNKVGNISCDVIEQLKKEYPQLTFRYRKSVKKEEINEALKKVDKDLGQTLFVSKSSIKPDGGIIEVKDDNNNWRIILVSEAKHQGKDIENILRGKLVGKLNNQDISSESIELLKQSDIVVTNPPFSLFREFVAQLVKFKKEFLIIGNINVITYKEIFKLIKENKVWLGINLGRGVSGFIVPKHYELYGTETQIDSLGNRIVSPNNCLWLTNLDTSKRHEDIDLIKKYYGNESDYPKYDNYNGINVDKTQNIPMDYDGFMGVPITFLHKFNPDQFEIIKFRKGNDEKDLSINGKCPYFRIIIRNKRIKKESQKTEIQQIIEAI
ncbi:MULTISPECIES: EcoRI family type II restriction endonuclease [Flavobacterium]|uniref:EcoRI family type II restriction endonuclease n=1 Tax=Flavobacterium TaxID=237 RepID=UPI0009BDB3D7|nr:EcoRI family type II restriction endonuclease [Flavobacterium covae]MCJ1809706.1 hypothetical protein [Flavobacterium covae]